mgnify:CR=1 FL=1
MENMEKMIVTEYGRPIMMQKVKEFAQRSIFLEDERVIPYAVFALLDNGELVNSEDDYVEDDYTDDSFDGSDDEF